MSLCAEDLRVALSRHGAVARVTVAATRGSAPREAGAAMLVWQDGQSGTIGGGTLEWQAAGHARRLLADRRANTQVDCPLGPGLGQCCGGHVTLVIEAVTPTMLAALEGANVYARPIGAAPPEPPLAIASARRRARQGQPIACCLAEGWFIEPVATERRPLWIYGAGHVGRAIIRVMEDLPFAITWIDDARTRYPGDIPAHADMLVAASPADAVPLAPDDAVHIVLTYSHADDLEICHRILSRPFGQLGLIGSATKKARFLKRLRTLGHSEAQLARLECPIGHRPLGKTPAAIAVGLAFRLLERQTASAARPALPQEARQ